MARVDEGTDGVLRDVARRVPGKEIWVTEWNPAGSEGAAKENRAETTTPAMMLQLVTRMSLAFLRHPQVTVAQYFSIRFKPDSPKCMFLAEKGGYRAVPAAVALRWLNVAANGGASYQRFIESGNPRIPGGGVRQETYGAVEAVLFRKKDGVTLILQNASGETRSWKIGADLKLGIPSHVERLAMPRLMDSTIRAAGVETVAPSTDIPIPAFSVTRAVWNIR